MTDDRIRLLLLDDNPSFIDSETGLPTFAAASGFDGQELLERNFALSWMFNLGQAKEYAARTRIALIDDPSELLRAARYPNLLWFDYCMDQALHKASDLDTLGTLEAYRAQLDPLRGDWGRKIDIFGFDDESFAAATEWQPSDGENQYGGCLAGVDISSLLDRYAYVGVPQTIHHNQKETAALEWHLSCHLGSLFERKSGALRNWFAFFERGLPALRDKLLLGCRRGSLIPRISDLLAVDGESDLSALAGMTLTFHSQLGTEALRVEALFLDEFYRWDIGEDAAVQQAPEDVRQTIVTWTSDLLGAAAGPGLQTDVRDGLATAARFIAAHADILHYQRRALSRELADASTAEIELAIEQNEPLLMALGFSPDAVGTALRAHEGGDLELSDMMALAWGTLDSVNKEAPTPESGRYAAIALIVWGELAWQCSVVGDFDSWFEQIEELLGSETLISAAIKERLEALSGLYVPQDLLERFEEEAGAIGHSAAALLAFGRQAAVFASIQEHVDLDGPPTRRGCDDAREPRRRVTQEIEAKHNFLRYLFAPAPRKLFLWQEAPTDVDKPLARLGNPEGALKLRIRAVLEGKPAADGGLLPGEMQLVRLFAREFGFAEHYWPAWMRRSN